MTINLLSKGGGGAKVVTPLSLLTPSYFPFDYWTQIWLIYYSDLKSFRILGINCWYFCKNILKRRKGRSEFSSCMVRTIKHRYKVQTLSLKKMDVQFCMLLHKYIWHKRVVTVHCRTLKGITYRMSNSRISHNTVQYISKKITELTSMRTFST